MFSNMFLHLVEHRLGFVARAVAGGLLHAVHQLVEILGLLVRILLALVALALGLARHFPGEALRRLAQVLHQLLDLVVARAALERLAQRLLGGAQIALGLGGVAVLDLLGHRPEQRGDVEKVGVGARRGERFLRLLHAEVGVGGRIEQLWRDGEPGQRRIDPLHRMVGIEDEVAALLDERARERVVKGALRQRHFDGRARARLPRDADGGERHLHARARPRMFGKVGGGAGLADAVAARRQLQGGLRRLRPGFAARAWRGRAGRAKSARALLSPYRSSSR